MKLKKYIFKIFYRLRNIFNCILLQQRHLTAGLIYNDFVQQKRKRLKRTFYSFSLYFFPEQVNGSNECSTSSSENTPPDKNGQIMPGGKFFLIYTFKKIKKNLTMGNIIKFRFSNNFRSPKVDEFSVSSSSRFQD